MLSQMLEFIENSGIAVWVRESPSIFAYTFVLSLHAIGLAIVVGISVIVGLRALGRFDQIPLQPIVRLYPVMWFGFAINAISGFLLLATNATNMLTGTNSLFPMLTFYIKMSFIVAAVVTLELLRPRLADEPGRQATKGLAFALIGFWLGAIVFGRLTAYPYFVSAWLGL
jgi:hypothetical protein